ncbi:MAG: electron transfer flavoprotein subunit alpha/FixB family protein [Chitinophagales bacterium]|nr:electron transfer flavoprotein subunit alpha/FixB family protein [Chitinophagales bacterium]MCZ2392440.1 electron transfer flavoprotein subunit alpha/FixB family protein [Chitinophagales bacterium]
MSVLFLIDVVKGQVKKDGLEAASYAAAIANQLGTEAVGLALGSINDNQLAEIGEYGAKKVIHVADAALDNFDSGVYTSVVAEIAKSAGASVIVISQNSTGKAVAPRLSARLQAGLVSGAVSLPDTSNGFVVKKTAFSGKAFAFVKVETEIKIVGLVPNAFGAVKTGGSATVESASASIPSSGVKVLEVSRAVGDTLPLPEAELVVSAGRGMKGPENWGIIEDLAKVLGATTACSRPVADIGWRPHHEHVGQTGVAIRPNLYIAVGISGAIQHLAGVNQSKVIVVINKDPEAPFFKAADYGIIGDAFEVVPKLTEAIKKFKAAQ